MLNVQYSVLPCSARLGVAHRTVLCPVLFCPPWSCSLYSILSCLDLPWRCSLYSTLFCFVLSALELLTVKYSVLPCSVRLGVTHCTVLCPARFCPHKSCSLYRSQFCLVLPWSCSPYSTFFCLVLPALELFTVQYAILPCSVCIGVAHSTVICHALFCPPWSLYCTLSCLVLPALELSLYST